MLKNNKICALFLCFLITHNSVAHADTIDEWMGELKTGITDFKEQNNSFNNKLKKAASFAITGGAALAAFATAPVWVTAGTAAAVGGAMLYTFSLGLGTTANLAADVAYQITDEDDPQVKSNFMSTLKTFASDASSNIISSITSSGISRLSGLPSEVVDVFDNAIGLSDQITNDVMNRDYDLTLKLTGYRSLMSKNGSIDIDDIDSDQESSIPSDWVSCSCPDKHSGYGKFSGSTLYHPDDFYCND